MTLYGIPNCNTVKKAQEWLKVNHVDFDFHDFKKKGIDKHKLKEWFDTFGWEKVINKNGLTFKKLNRTEQEKMDNAEVALDYLLENTSAIKRPILEKDGKAILLGFIEQDYEKVLG